MTPSEIQAWIDERFLRRMAETNTGSYFEWFALPLSAFTTEPYITREMASACCKSLRDRGFARFERGLWTEDGDMAGAGYRITKDGVEYLKTLTTPSLPPPSPGGEK